MPASSGLQVSRYSERERENSPEGQGKDWAACLKGDLCWLGLPPRPGPRHVSEVIFQYVVPQSR